MDKCAESCAKEAKGGLPKLYQQILHYLSDL